MTAAFAIASALVAPQRTGEGVLHRRVDARRGARRDGLGGVQLPDRRRRAACRMGNDNFTAAPSGAFRTERRACSTSPPTSRSSSRRCAGAVGRPDLGERPALRPAREPQDATARALTDELERGAREALARGVGAAVQQDRRARRLRPLRARRRWRCRRSRSAAARRPSTTCPDGRPADPRRRAPASSSTATRRRRIRRRCSAQHTDEVLASAGYCAREIAALREGGAYE